VTILISFQGILCKLPGAAIGLNML